MVSIHASAREATACVNLIANTVASFNPRLRTGGDVVRIYTKSFMSMFQSTPPHGRRPQARANWTLPLSRFNPRLRTGGDDWDRLVLDGFATVSIHASAREATNRINPIMVRQAGFNPRLRTGGDHSRHAVTTFL